MFVDEMRRAVMGAPRERLAALAGALWKGHAGGALTDDEAQGLAELIEARKVVPVEPKPRRSVGSRPRATQSIERRRRWVAAGLMPPQISCQFTPGEGAALAVIAAEVAKKGRCTLTLGHIAALAGTCRTTVRNAVRQAAALGLLRSEEWRLSAFRSAPNTVTIISLEWTAWLRLGRRATAPRDRSITGAQAGQGGGRHRQDPSWVKGADNPRLNGGGVKFVQPTNTQDRTGSAKRVHMA